MNLGKAVHFISVVIDSAVKILSKVAAAVLLFMMLLTGADVAMRYLFNAPILGAYELTTLLMVVVVGFGLAYCQFMGSNIRADVLTSKLSKSTQAVFTSIADFVFLILFILIAWQSIYRAQTFMETASRTEVLSIPQFPFAFVVTIASVALCLVLLRDFINDLKQVKKK